MRRGKESAPKPEREIQALVKLILTQSPDLLGVSEIGTTADLADLQTRLKTAGLDLPHSEHSGGRDQSRHLGFLSRYPITERNSQRELSYQLVGKEFLISRGILDISVEINSLPVRFLGAHLKSKREVKDADQELIRQNEALLLRQYANRILKEEPDSLLYVYGDFNDSIKSKTLSILKGRSRTSAYLSDHYFQDSRKELWTYFWDYQDSYSRIDYVLSSKAAKLHINPSFSLIVDAPDWNLASDHRALLLVLEF